MTGCRLRNVAACMHLPVGNPTCIWVTNLILEVTMKRVQHVYAKYGCIEMDMPVVSLKYVHCLEKKKHVRIEVYVCTSLTGAWV